MASKPTASMPNQLLKAAKLLEDQSSRGVSSLGIKPRPAPSSLAVPLSTASFGHASTSQTPPRCHPPKLFLKAHNPLPREQLPYLPHNPSSRDHPKKRRRSCQIINIDCPCPAQHTIDSLRSIACLIDSSSS